MKFRQHGGRRRIRSYGGAEVDAVVHTPRSVDELRAVLRAASGAGARVTFRGGGCAFDSQSLNDDVVVEMSAMRSFEVDPEAATVTADAGVTWGDIVRATVPHGLVPHALVTTRHASIAGTTSADCLARFSPTFGKEGAHVLSFDLVTPEGELLTCSRQQNADVFHAAIGGLGYLGAITRVTARLLRLGYAPRVETVLTPYRSIRDFLVDLLPQEGQVEGLYGAMYRDRALHFRSRYVPSDRRRRPFPLLHQPRSILRALVDLLIRAPALNRLGSWLTFHLASGRARTYVDDFEDYAFFMDGNGLAKSIGRAFGAPMRMVQQTFALPVERPGSGGGDDRGMQRGVDATLRFIESLRAGLRADGIAPTMLDCVFLPKDEGFLLSSSGRFDSFGLSVAFDTSNERILARVRAQLVEASARCRAMGGRVHLVKNVHCDPADLAAMYGDDADAFFALKRRLDPRGVLQNEFLARLFPAHAAAWRASAIAPAAPGFVPTAALAPASR